MIVRLDLTDGRYQRTPISKADLKALSAYLNGLADEPPTANIAVTLGVFHLQIQVEAK